MDAGVKFSIDHSICVYDEHLHKYPTEVEMAKKSRSNKKSSKARSTRRNNNTNKGSRKNGSRKMMSVNDIRKRFQEMDVSVKNFVKTSNPRGLGEHVSRQWSRLFNKHLSPKAASSLATHYMNTMKRTVSKKRGGSMSGAPLDYVMRPGLPAVATYATFPTEVGVDPKSVANLDVYFNSGLSRSCGTENTGLTVPADMGSNQVVKGGRRRRGTRKYRGGDFMTAMAARPYIAENPGTFVQRMGETYHGVSPSPYDIAEPSQSAFRLVSDGKLPIDPSGISLIDKDITQLANPSPYPAVR